MTQNELCDALNDIRWTPATLAQALECDVSLVHAWLSGNVAIPVGVAAWVRVLADCHRAVELEKPKSLKGKRHVQ